MTEPQDRARSGRRVVSLVPSITESLLDWGVKPVAVTRFCPAPGVTTVGGTKNPDVRAIVDLGPDVVLMDQEENRRQDATALEAAGVSVVATRVRSVGDVSTALESIALAAGVHVPIGSGATRPEPEDGEPPIPVFVPIWRRPLMTVSGQTYGSSMLAAAGLLNVYDDPGDGSALYPEVELAAVVKRRPRFVLAPSEPYAFSDRHRPELEQIAPMVLVDGQDLFWWGTRTHPAIRRMAALASALRQR